VVNLLSLTIANNGAASGQVIIPYGIPGGGYGGGIFVSSGTVTMGNTILANNSAPTAGNDIYGALTSRGNNLIGSTAGGSGFGPSDLQNVNPLLGPFQNNGGPTGTLAPQPGSPAIDAGSDSLNGSRTLDQRGFARKVGQHVDIGAAEWQYDLALFGGQTFDPVSNTITYTFVVLNNGPDAVAGVMLNDPLPAGTLFQALTASSGVTTTAPAVNQNGTVTLTNAGALQPGQTLSLSIKVALTAGAGSTIANTATLSSTSTDTNPLNNSVTLTLVNATEGAETVFNLLYHFNGTGNGTTPAAYAATVNWGDGTSNSTNDSSGKVSVVANPSGGFDVVGAHTYAEAGSYNPSVTVTGSVVAGSLSGPAHQYKGEGNAADSAGSTRGTIVGNVTYVPGVLGQAFGFNGNDSQVDFGSAGFGTADFSVDFWIKTTSTDVESILGNRMDGYHGNFFSVHLGGGAPGHLSVEIDQDSQGTNYISVISNGVVNDGSFHHVAIVRQGPTLSLYIDGTLSGSVTGAGVANLTNPNPLRAGFETIDDQGLGVQSFTGVMDELTIYNRAQTAGEIQGLYLATGKGLAMGGSVTAGVADVPLIAGAFTPAQAVEGKPVTNAVLFHFSDANPLAAASDFTATVIWGDGKSNVSNDGGNTVSVVANPNGGFDVLGSHTYAEELTQATYSVKVSDRGGAAPLNAGTSSFSVADAPLTGMGNALTGLKADPRPPGVVVAAFNDLGGSESVSEYYATIQWGDGSQSTGSIYAVPNTNSFIVEGQHAYAAAGVFTIIVLVNHDTAPTLQIRSTASILDALVGLPANSPEGATVTVNAASATGTSANPAGLRYLYQVYNPSYGTAVIGRTLTFTGSDYIPLPNGFVQTGPGVTVDVTFRTTKGGVILGAQTLPPGSASASTLPALYVGTDGKLYAEWWNGIVDPIVSKTAVNDGLPHRAVMSPVPSGFQLTLDGVRVGSIVGKFLTLNAPFNQLGTGNTFGFPAGNGVFMPFVGTLDSVVISASPTLAAALALPGPWQVDAQSGQTQLSAQNLTFTGSNTIPLPSGLIHDATNLTLDIAFHTTAGGVILGYQNQPAGTAPTHWVPALYVGTDGKLYGELWNGAVNPLQSSSVVNDGQPHRAVLTLTGSALSLTLDGVTVGQLTGPFDQLDMTFNQLGTGETAFWPAGNSGYFPFVGTLDRVTITTNATVAASPALDLFVPGRLQFTPPEVGSYTISLASTTPAGRTVMSSQTLTVTDALLTAQATPVTTAVAGTPFSGEVATFTDANPMAVLRDFPPTGITIQWGDGTSSQATAVAQDAAGVFHVYGSHTYSHVGPTAQPLTVAIADSEGAMANTSYTPTVANPTTADPGDPYTIFEGESATFSAAESTDETGDALTYTWTINGQMLAPSSSPTLSLSWPELQALGIDEGPATFTVQVQVEDSQGYDDVNSTTLQLNELGPAATATGPTDGVPGQERTYQLSVFDPSNADQVAGFRYAIDWGDGSPVQIVNATAGNGTGIAVSHTYSQLGTFAVTVFATDKDGDVSPAATTPITISLGGLQLDPLDSSKTALVFGTLPGSDNLLLFQTDPSGAISVSDNGVELGQFQPTGHLIVYANGANDDVEVADTALSPTMLFGGTGNDTLVGGGGPNVIVGGSGTNQIYGGSISDLLIGGLGQSTIVARSGDALEIAGTTSFDDNLEALAAILAEWSSTDSYAARVANLIGQGNGDGSQLNGNYFLQAGTTVFSNGLGDTLEAGSGQDLLFAHVDGSGVLDVLNNLKDGDQVIDL
jgi:uncharacterized repeat protein (TIGR01451 family)